MKFQSCMTLFRKAEPDTPEFQKALDIFYDGLPDESTLVLAIPATKVAARFSHLTKAALQSTVNDAFEVIKKAQELKTP